MSGEDSILFWVSSLGFLGGFLGGRGDDGILESGGGGGGGRLWWWWWDGNWVVGWFDGGILLGGNGNGLRLLRWQKWTVEWSWRFLFDVGAGNGSICLTLSRHVLPTARGEEGNLCLVWEMRFQQKRKEGKTNVGVFHI